MMLHFPPFPAWDSIHPLIIHFPVALLLLTPLFIVIAAAMPAAKSRPYMIASLIILLLGTGSLFLAGSSGEEAAELADRSGGVNAVLMAHEKLASQTEVVFSTLSIILLAIYAVPKLMHLQERRLTTTMVPVAFLPLYAVGLLFLINTGHAGGRLVHEFGVHAIIPAATEQTAAGQPALVQTSAGVWHETE